MRLLYEGKDITDEVVVDRCVVDVRESGRLPALTVTFDDADGDWGGWNPKPGDSIEATCDGACGSGKMFVSEARPMRGKMMLKAIPVKHPQTAKTQMWRNSTMLKAVNQMASQLSLGVSVHGASDISFKYLVQDGRRNLAAMSECCALLGCMLDVFDGTAHVSSIKWAMSQSPVGTIEVTDESNHDLRSTPSCGSYRAHQAAVSHSDMALDRKELEASSSSGSGYSRAWEVPTRIGFSSASQMRQCCEGLLIYSNSRAPLSSAVLDRLVPWTPGSIIYASCDEVPAKSGNAMVSRVRCDFVSGKSKVWWRMV